MVEVCLRSIVTRAAVFFGGTEVSGGEENVAVWARIEERSLVGAAEAAAPRFSGLGWSVAIEERSFVAGGAPLDDGQKRRRVGSDASVTVRALGRALI
jgi:hypothetical protein